MAISFNDRRGHDGDRRYGVVRSINSPHQYEPTEGQKKIWEKRGKGLGEGGAGVLAKPKGPHDMPPMKMAREY